MTADDLDLGTATALATTGLGLLTSLVLNKLAAAQASGASPAVTSWVHRAIEVGRVTELNVQVAQAAWLADYRDIGEKQLLDDSTDPATRESASLAVLGTQLVEAAGDGDTVRTDDLVKQFGQRVCAAGVNTVLDAVVRDLADETGAPYDRVLNILQAEK